MKRFMLYAALIASMLTGCGGDGGGSSSAAPAPPDPIDPAEYNIFSRPPANETANIIERDGNPDNPADDYVLIQRDASGIMFTYRDVDNRDVLGDADSMRSFHISTGTGSIPDDFNDAGNYLRAVEDSGPVVISNRATAAGLVNGVYETTNIMEVGGKKMGLEFADFGMWKTTSTFTGTINGVNADRTLMHDPENLTDEMRGSGREAYFTANAGTASYTGNAMGVVREVAAGGGDDAAGTGAEIYGTASLNLDLATRKANLDLNFANFYNFAFGNLALRSNGSFEDTDTSTLTKTVQANTTGIDFDGNVSPRNDFDVDGQFYGPASTSPTEATGTAEIEHYQGNGKRIDVDIAFGVK